MLLLPLLLLRAAVSKNSEEGYLVHDMQIRGFNAVCIILSAVTRGYRHRLAMGLGCGASLLNATHARPVLYVQIVKVRRRRELPNEQKTWHDEIDRSVYQT